MRSFFGTIQRMNPRNKNISVTIITGSNTGEKALFSDGELLKCTGAQNWFHDHAGTFGDLSGAGILETDGYSVFYEQLAGRKKLVVCGAGHVGLAVTRMGKLLGYHVTVIDDRMEFADKAEAAGADAVITSPYDSGLNKIAGDGDTCFIIVTRGHCNDLESLKEILKKEYAYVGLMGSRRKTVMLKESLKAEGCPDEVISQIHMPVGLQIGAETPEEIAVCIMGEIIQCCNNGEKRYGYDQEILDALCQERGSEVPVILATVIDKTGSAPRGVGSRMLVSGDGRILGTVGGGIVEARTLKKARQMLGDDSSAPVQTLYVDLDGETTVSRKMICGGRMEVLLERFDQ